MNKFIRLAVVVMLAAMLISCGTEKDAQKAASETSTEIRPQIGIVFDSFVIERWQRDRDVFVATASDLGADVNVQCANGDADEQNKIIDYFIQKKMDAIVIIPVDCEALTNEVEKARKAGICVVAYDRLIMNTDIDLYVSFDNEAVGQLMAQTINQNLPDGGNVIKVNGPQEDNNVELVNKGFDETIASNIKIIGENNCSGWVGEEAFEYLNDHIEQLDQADAIMCGNDSLAGQAERALAEQRRAGKVIIVGQDADLDACQRIVQGTQTMTVYKPIEELARVAAQDTMYLIGKHSIPNIQTLGNGSVEVPFVCIEPVMVDKKNMDSVIIGSGFHLQEDVYRK